MDQWTTETGDTLPSLDEMTPERMARDSWKAIYESGRPHGGVVPGQSTKAHHIDKPGPIREADVRAERPGVGPK